VKLPWQLIAMIWWTGNGAISGIGEENRGLVVLSIKVPQYRRKKKIE
jgi:hypothetical protein